MSWIETWIDTATAPPLATIVTALDQSGAKGINFYLGGRFSGGSGWTPQLSVQLAQQRPDVGQFGTWVSLSPGQGGYAVGHQDGLDCVAAAKAYPAIAWLDYDVEPETWQANPQGVDDAMRGFADAVHAAGYHCLDYGTPDTVAGASNEDDVWIANPNPGGDDPAIQPLNPAYYAGKRAVQYGSGTFGGVTWDVSHSEFSISPGDDFMATGPLSDPTAQQHLLDTVDGAYWLARSGYDGDPNGATPPAHYGIFKDVPAMLANVQAAIAGLTPAAVDVNALATALAAHPLTATLSDAERDAVATHVLQHLAKDATAG